MYICNFKMASTIFIRRTTVYNAGGCGGKDNFMLHTFKSSQRLCGAKQVFSYFIAILKGVRSLSFLAAQNVYFFRNASKDYVQNRVDTPSKGM